MANNWSIEHNDDINKWYLTFSSSIDEAKPNVEDIYLEIRRKGIDTRTVISKQKIQDYINEESKMPNVPAPLLLQLDPSFDVRVIISNDKLSAKLYVRKAFDISQSLPMNIILRSLQNSKIKDLNMADINATLAQFGSSSNMELEMTIKTGTAPKRKGNHLKMMIWSFLFQKQNNLHILRLTL